MQLPALRSPLERAAFGFPLCLCFGWALMVWDPGNRGDVSLPALASGLLGGMLAGVVGVAVVRGIGVLGRRLTPAAVFTLLGGILFLALAVFVWPTRYRHDTVHMGDRSFTARVDRFSGATEIMTPRGWRRVNWSQPPRR